MNKFFVFFTGLLMAGYGIYLPGLMPGILWIILGGYHIGYFIGEIRDGL